MKSIFIIVITILRNDYESHNSYILDYPRRLDLLVISPLGWYYLLKLLISDNLCCWPRRIDKTTTTTMFECSWWNELSPRLGKHRHDNSRFSASSSGSGKIRSLEHFRRELLYARWSSHCSRRDVDVTLSSRLCSVVLGGPLCLKSSRASWVTKLSFVIEVIGYKIFF